jgi:hypothetical protein
MRSPKYMGTAAAKAYHPGNLIRRSFGINSGAIMKLFLAVILFLASPLAGIAQGAHVARAFPDAGELAGKTLRADR